MLLGGIEYRPDRAENPLDEIAIMQMFQSVIGPDGRPGHPNVCRLIECVNDSLNIYSVLEYYNGGINDFNFTN
jgi:hypothetical protein